MARNLKPILVDGLTTRKWFTAGAVILLLSGAVAVFYAYRHHSTSPAMASVCTYDTLSRANSAIQSQSDGTMLTVVNTILRLPHYDTDPNCLYVIVTYDINTGDPKAARAHLNQLNKVYDPRLGFDRTVTRAAGRDINALNSSVKFLESTAKSSLSNTRGE